MTVEDPVKRVDAVLGTQGRPLYEDECWKEVGCVVTDPTREQIIWHAEDSQPEVYLILGCQMFRLKIPVYPSTDLELVARPNI